MNFNELKNNLNTLNKEARIDELKRLNKMIKDRYCLQRNDMQIWCSEDLQNISHWIDKRISELIEE